MTGSPAANASIALKPPAFSTSASDADMSPGIWSVQPSTVPPSPRSSSDARSLSSFPHTVIAWYCGPHRVIASTVDGTSPTPHEPATTSTARSCGSMPRLRRMSSRSGRWVRNLSPTSGPDATLL